MIVNRQAAKKKLKLQTEIQIAKYKMLPPAFSKRMIREYLKGEGYTNIRYSGKRKIFYYLNEKGEECKLSQNLINTLLSTERNK